MTAAVVAAAAVGVVDASAAKAPPAPAAPPVVTIASVSPAAIGPGGTSVVTWSASKKGTYAVRVGGSGCDSGSLVRSGDYPRAGASVATPIAVASLAEGANVLRVCVTASRLTGSDTEPIVRDTTGPALSGSLSSTGATEGWAKAGDTLTVSVQSSEPLAALPGVACFGRALPVSTIDGTHWSASVTLSPLDAEGAVSCSLAGGDALGNTGSGSASGVTYDRSAPILDGWLESSGEDPAWATHGDVITVNAQSSEALSSIEETCVKSVELQQLTATTWEGTFSIDTATPEGPLSCLLDGTDLAGNAAHQIELPGPEVDHFGPDLQGYFASSNADPAIAVIGDTISLHVTGGEPLSSAGVNCAGASPELTRVSDTNFSGSFVVWAGWPLGPLSCEIYGRDLAGNANSETISTGITVVE